MVGLVLLKEVTDRMGLETLGVTSFLAVLLPTQQLQRNQKAPLRLLHKEPPRQSVGLSRSGQAF